MWKKLKRKARKLSRKAKRGAKRAGRTIRKKGGRLAKSRIGRKLLKSGLRAVPILGTAYSVYDIAKEFSGGSAPAPSRMLPTSLARTGLPSIPGMNQNLPMGSTGGFGIPRGPGGKVQLPWNDPATPAVLKSFALDDKYLKQQVRAPKGYVVVRDAQGRPYPLLRSIAIQFKLWKPSKKPPISVGDYQALKRADRTVKKFKKIYTMTARVQKNTAKGGKVRVTKRS